MLKDRLREARKRAGKTQKEVAAAIGVSESAYCGYETGKRQPDAVKIVAIASFLGISGDFLLEIEQPEAELSLLNPGDICISEDERELVGIYRALNADGKATLLATARGFAGNPAMKEEKRSSETA